MSFYSKPDDNKLFILILPLHTGSCNSNVARLALAGSFRPSRPSASKQIPLGVLFPIQVDTNTKAQVIIVPAIVCSRRSINYIIIHVWV